MMELTILHVSDPQFGSNHLFGGNGLTPADHAHDTLFRRLHDDLSRLADEHGLRPDLMVVTGDLAERGKRSEFDRVVEFLAALAEALGSRGSMWRSCQATTMSIAPPASLLPSNGERRAGAGAPYWPKWRYFAAAFDRF